MQRYLRKHQLRSIYFINGDFRFDIEIIVWYSDTFVHSTALPQPRTPLQGRVCTYVTHSIPLSSPLTRRRLVGKSKQAPSQCNARNAASKQVGTARGIKQSMTSSQPPRSSRLP